MRPIPPVEGKEALRDLLTQRRLSNDERLFRSAQKIGDAIDVHPRALYRAKGKAAANLLVQTWLGRRTASDALFHDLLLVVRERVQELPEGEAVLDELKKLLGEPRHVRGRSLETLVESVASAADVWWFTDAVNPIAPRGKDLVHSAIVEGLLAPPEECRSGLLASEGQKDSKLGRDRRTTLCFPDRNYALEWWRSFVLLEVEDVVSQRGLTHEEALSTFESVAREPGDIGIDVRDVGELARANVLVLDPLNAREPVAYNYYPGGPSSDWVPRLLQLPTYGAYRWRTICEGLHLGRRPPIDRRSLLEAVRLSSA